MKEILGSSPELDYLSEFWTPEEESDLSPVIDGLGKSKPNLKEELEKINKDTLDFIEKHRLQKPIEKPLKLPVVKQPPQEKKHITRSGKK